MTLQGKIIEFGRFLQARGLSVPPTRAIGGVAAADLVGPGSARDLMVALRAAFCDRPETFAAFERHFQDFFFAPDQPAPPAEPPRTGQGPEAPVLGAALGAEDDGVDDDQAATPASALEVLGRTGFNSLDPGQAELAAREVEALLVPLARRLSRRRRPGGREEPAWRATVRRSMAAGGEMVDLRFRRRRVRRVRLLVLADVSGSMDLTAPYVFHFLKGLAAAWRQVEVFVFATRLTRVTPWLAGRPVPEFLDNLGSLVPDLAGGTRLAQALRGLWPGYGRLITSSSVALIFSDGWDRGDPGALAHGMATLHRRCRRVIWLNPLLESPRYQPLNQGMAAALPYVDHFLACHNLAVLRKAAQVLENALKRP
jgi:uncharacterized protein